MNQKRRTPLRHALLPTRRVQPFIAVRRGTGPRLPTQTPTSPHHRPTRGDGDRGRATRCLYRLGLRTGRHATLRATPPARAGEHVYTLVYTGEKSPMHRCKASKTSIVLPKQMTRGRGALCFSRSVLVRPTPRKSARAEIGCQAHHVSGDRRRKRG